MAGVGSVVGVPAIVAVFLLASMFGALLSLMAIRNWSQASEVRRQKSGPWLPIRNPKSEIRNQVAVPYGVAISLAVLTIAGFWIT
jgi:Flp pilus assembly protein protease CpaA